MGGVCRRTGGLGALLAVGLLVSYRYPQTPYEDVSTPGPILLAREVSIETSYAGHCKDQLPQPCLIVTKSWFDKPTEPHLTRVTTT